ncbi:MAG: thioredoxin domain-containing protein [Deltaproteobacteria bacterium]|nr:thioredoxin domain-containing protein [Deltaproteobacteria bacterium]
MKREQVFLILILVFVGGYVIGRASHKPSAATGPAMPAAAAPAQLAAASPVPAAVASPSPAPSPAPSPSPSPAPSSAPSPSPSPAPSAPADPNQIWRAVIHDDDAKKGPDSVNVKVVIFGAFGNQETVDFAPALDSIVKEFGDKVQIRWKHKVVPMPHPDSIYASEVAAAANAQGKFWPLFDKLIKNASISPSSIESAAKESGVQWDKVKKEVESGKWRMQVLRDSLLASEIAANTYPNIMVNGVRLAAPKTYDRLKPIIEEQLKKSEEQAKSMGKRWGTSFEGVELYQEIVKSGKNFEQMAGPKQTFDTAGSPILGKPTAKIQVAVFEDFQCPFCAKVGPSLKEFQKKFPNDVAIVYKHMPLDIHDKAQAAAEASMAALEQGQDKFWAYHDVLFNNQNALDQDNLVKYAEQAGLDMARFKKALESGSGKSVIGRDVGEGQRAGVSGTPSVYVNGMKYQGPRGYPPEGLEAVARTYFGL